MINFSFSLFGIFYSKKYSYSKKLKNTHDFNVINNIDTVGYNNLRSRYTIKTFSIHICISYLKNDGFQAAKEHLAATKYYLHTMIG